MAGCPDAVSEPRVAIFLYLRCSHHNSKLLARQHPSVFHKTLSGPSVCSSPLPGMYLLLSRLSRVYLQNKLSILFAPCPLKNSSPRRSPSGSHSCHVECTVSSPIHCCRARWCRRLLFQAVSHYCRCPTCLRRRATRRQFFFPTVSVTTRSRNYSNMTINIIALATSAVPLRRTYGAISRPQ